MRARPNESSAFGRWKHAILMLLLGLVPAMVGAFAIGVWGPWGPMDRALVSGIILFLLWCSATTVIGASLSARARGPSGHRVDRSLYRLHLELGAVVAPFAFVLFFSGAGAVAARSLADWEQAPLMQARPRGPAFADQPLDRMIDQVMHKDFDAPRGSLRIYPATEHRSSARIEARSPERSTLIQHFDPVTGEPLVEGNGPLRVLIELHRSLLVPASVGETLVASWGILFAVVLVAGLATRQHWVRELFRFRRRRMVPEIHKLLGLWTFVFGIGAALSGAIVGGSALSVPVMVSSAYQGDKAALFADVLAAERRSSTTVASTQQSIAALAQPSCMAEDFVKTRWWIDRITLQQPGSTGRRITAEYKGAGPWLERVLVVYDAEGQETQCRVLRRQSGMLQLFYAIMFVHYADVGGSMEWLIELLWIGGGIALAGGALMGEVIRQNRRLRQGQPVGRWARGMLAGWGVGLPLGVIALLLLGRVCPYGARAPGVAPAVLLAVWAVAWRWSAVGPSARTPRQAARGLGAWAGAGLLATAAASRLTTDMTMVDRGWAWMGAAILGGLWLSRARAKRRRAGESTDKA